jgi:hypothetical protein
MDASHEVKGFVVFTVNVGNLVPNRAEAFIERMQDRLVAAKPDGWSVIVTPNRTESRVEVFCLDGVPTAIEPYVLEGQKLMRSLHLTTPQLLKDQTLLLLGAPVFKVSEDVIDYLDYLLEEVETYGISHKSEYLLNKMQEATEVIDEKVELKENAKT